MKWAALALVVVGLAIVSLWWRGNGERGAAREASEEAREPAPGAAPAELVTPGEVGDPARAPATAGEAPRVAVAPAPAEEPQEETDELELSGTIVVVDEHGVEHATEDGSFRLTAWTSSSGAGAEVTVRAGRWTAAIPCSEAGESFASVSLESVVLGGRAAAGEHEWPDPLALPQARARMPVDGFLALRVRWVRVSVLRVRDRASGRELAPVLLADAGDAIARHPGAAAALAQDLGPSPVVVPPGWVLWRERALHVGSPGYSWGRVVVDEIEGGERIVPLEPGGDLEVALTGAEPDPAARLRVLGDGEFPLFERELDGVNGPIAIDALPAGRWRAVVALGEIWDEPLVLAEAEAEVVADTRSKVTLALEALAVERAPVAGTLLVPPEWELPYFYLTFELLGRPLGGQPERLTLGREKLSPTPERGMYSWSLGEVQPGRYHVELEALAFHTSIDVPPKGLQDARVEVPPPCTVAVRCVDDASGTDAAVEHVWWVGELPANVGYSPQSASYDEATRSWTFRAPQGRLMISAHGHGLEGTTLEVETLTGHNDVELRIRPATGLRLVLHDGATQIPWTEEWSVELHPLDGQDAKEGWCYAGELRHREPGRYRLSFGEIPGYEPVPDLEVRLEAGVIGEHAIELVRRP